MVYFDHGMLGATLAVAVGAHRRLGWPAVVLAALAAMFPDWDAMSKHISPQTYQAGHRVWGHNLFAVTLAGIALGGLGYLIHNSRPGSHPPSASAPGSCWVCSSCGLTPSWTSSTAAWSGTPTGRCGCCGRSRPEGTGCRGCRGATGGRPPSCWAA